METKNLYVLADDCKCATYEIHDGIRWLICECGE